MLARLAADISALHSDPLISDIILITGSETPRREENLVHYEAKTKFCGAPTLDLPSDS